MQRKVKEFSLQPTTRRPCLDRSSPTRHLPLWTLSHLLFLSQNQDFPFAKKTGLQQQPPLSSSSSPHKPPFSPLSRRSLSHLSLHFPLSSRQIFSLQPITTHDLPYQHRRNKASFIGADRPPVRTPAVFFISSPPALWRHPLPIIATPPPHS